MNVASISEDSFIEYEKKNFYIQNIPILASKYRYFFKYNLVEHQFKHEMVIFSWCKK